MKNLTQTLIPFHQSNPVRSSMGLRFPISRNWKHLYYDTSFWIEMSFRFLQNPSMIPVFFWTVPENDQSTYLFLYFREPLAKSFLHMIKEDVQDDSLCKLDKEGEGDINKITESIPRQYLTLLELSELTMSDFLHRIHSQK